VTSALAVMLGASWAERGTLGYPQRHVGIIRTFSQGEVASLRLLPAGTVCFSAGKAREGGRKRRWDELLRLGREGQTVLLEGARRTYTILCGRAGAVLSCARLNTFNMPIRVPD